MVKTRDLVKSIKSGLSTSQKREVQKALNIAFVAHKGQFRKGVKRDPYIRHPLRVAIKARELAADYLTKDVLVIALLHDSIEDGVKNIVAEYIPGVPEYLSPQLYRALGSAYISGVFSKEISEQVLNLTIVNDNFGRKLSDQERSDIYYSKVTQTVQKGPLTYLVKLSDLFDNVTHIDEENLSPRSLSYLVGRYRRIPSLFRAALELYEYDFKEETKVKILETLTLIEEKLASLES